MRITSNILLAALLATTSTLFNCKGKDGVPGPQGKQGEAAGTKLWDAKDGYVKSTVSGTRSDGTVFNWNIDFRGTQQYSEYETTNYVYNSNGKKRIDISRYYAEEGDPFEYGRIQIVFTVNSLDDLSDPVVNLFNYSCTKDLGNNTLHTVFYHPILSLEFPVEVKDLRYNKSTGILEGKFSAENPGIDSDPPVSFKDGSFSCKLLQVNARMDSGK